MSIAAIFAATNAALYSIREEEEERRRKEEIKKQRKKRVSLLLLQGKEYSMDIGSEEKIIVIKIIYDPSYKNIYNKWLAKIDKEVIVAEENFSKCFDETIKKFNVRGYSLVPYGTSGGVEAIVDAYWLMLKVPDETQIEKIKSLNKMADDLTKQTQIEW